MSKMKKQFKKTAVTVIKNSKKVVGKNPRVRDAIKRILSASLNLSPDTVRMLQNQMRYSRWVAENYPDAVESLRQRAASGAFEYRPLISIVTPTYNTDIQFLRECIESVQSQHYDNWQLCIVDDASPNAEVRDVIKEYAAADKRITYHFSKTNQHIADASNTAIGLAKGEFLALLDHDDILWPNALYEVVKALNANKKLDFIYSDEDKITSNRRDFQNPFFKPDWNPDFLYSVNYITHFSVVRTSLAQKLGGFRKEYNGAQDWDFFMRITNTTKQIHHIPTVLYSWRMSETSTAQSTDAKPYVVEAQHSAIQDDLARKGYHDVSVEVDKRNNGYWKVTYPVRDNPLVSIIIPTKDQYVIVKRCVESIQKKTTYKNYEIILVDTGSSDSSVHRWYSRLQKQHDNIHVVDWPEQPFSYARSCNEGARQAKGEFLVMLNNDTEVLTANWLQLLLGDAQRPEIGAVGCKLFYPDKEHIQHAGVGIGFGGVAANSFSPIVDHLLPPLQHLYLNTRHNVTAVTAACLMIRKDVYDQIDGFDEEFRVTYNDVDLCLRLVEAGYRNLYTPYVQLIHHESISVGMPEEVKKRDTTEMHAAMNLFVKRWKKYIDHDPHLNPNIERSNALFEVKIV